MHARKRQIDAWVGWGVGLEPGAGGNSLPIEPSKAFILPALLSGTRKVFLLRSRFYQMGFIFSHVVLKEEPLTKHKQTCEEANEKSLISKTPGCYYLDATAAGTNSERRMIHCHGY